MTDTAFIRMVDFPWFLRVMMSMADVRPGELSAETGIPTTTIYDLRCGQTKPSRETVDKLLNGLERWCPGVTDMMRAAEKARINRQIPGIEYEGGQRP